LQRSCTELGTETRIEPTEAIGVNSLNSFEFFLYVLNMGPKHLAFQVIRLVYWHFIQKSKCIVVSLETKLSTSGEIRIIRNGLHRDSDEYGLKTCLTPTEGSSGLTLHIE
jgi:hypothetical protein